MIKTPKVLPLLAVEKWKKCMSLRHEAHVKVKKAKAPRVRSTFGSWDVEKVHAVVAWSTFPSQNVQNTPTSDHFWKLWCWKGARPCGAKHISKSKFWNTGGLRHFWKLRWWKSARLRGTKLISKSNVFKTGGLGPRLERWWKSARRCGAKHISKSKVLTVSDHFWKLGW